MTRWIVVDERGEEGAAGIKGKGKEVQCPTKGGRKKDLDEGFEVTSGKSELSCRGRMPKTNRRGSTTDHRGRRKGWEFEKREKGERLGGKVPYQLSGNPGGSSREGKGLRDVRGKGWRRKGGGCRGVTHCTCTYQGKKTLPSVLLKREEVTWRGGS